MIWYSIVYLTRLDQTKTQQCAEVKHSNYSLHIFCRKLVIYRYNNLMSLLFSTQDEGGGSFTEQLAFKSYHFLSTIVVFKPRFLLRTHAKRFVTAICPITTQKHSTIMIFFSSNDFIPRKH